MKEVNAAVAAEVLDRVRQGESAFLQRLVLLVPTAMGYGGEMRRCDGRSKILLSEQQTRASQS